MAPLDSLAIAARAIRAGEADLVVAGGVESMSRAPFVMPKAASAWSRANEVHDTTIGWRFVNPRMQERYDTDAMPQTAEHVAAEHGVAREDQDAFALRSQERAAKAIANGRLAREITGVPVPQPKGDPVVVDRDEHPRETSLEALARLRPLFPGGTVTAGNSSGVNDGAAAVLVASERAVARYGLQPLARVGRRDRRRPPRVMGIGPVPATRKLLARAGVAMTTSTSSSSTRRSRPRPSQCCARWACPTTPSTSIPTAARSRSATRSAPAALGSR